MLARRAPAQIRVGIGGWTYAPWRGVFYPADLVQRRELEFAAGRLSSIEINGTFYSAQKPESFGRWREETPADFVFALKAPRYATHRRSLASAGAAVERFLSGGVLQLQEKLGPINWQLPPEMSFDPTDFEAFLKLLPPSLESRALRHAVEVRHASFRSAACVELARRYGVALVLAGDSNYPWFSDVTGSFLYLRLMGTRSGEPLGYATAEIARWAERARCWADGGAPADLPPLLAGQAPAERRDVFVYFISGFKVSNPAAAQGLISQLQEMARSSALPVR
ncbi:MAG TPA: DUF72 domain-containing protein [Steroidobacteraceae bacterium]|jgi:uncharacterized protein YecE (DUF72 family)|nr:DUF72 domain-containing protein [Steroidobacteraceae bacterium]